MDNGHVHYPSLGYEAASLTGGGGGEATTADRRRRDRTPAETCCWACVEPRWKMHNGTAKKTFERIPSEYLIFETFEKLIQNLFIGPIFPRVSHIVHSVSPRTRNCGHKRTWRRSRNSSIIIPIPPSPCVNLNSKSYRHIFARISFQNNLGHAAYHTMNT